MTRPLRLTRTGWCSSLTVVSSTRLSPPPCRRCWRGPRTSPPPQRGPEMLRVTLKGLRGHLVRLLLTASAVMLGVSFVTGTFVLRDSIDNTLSGLVAGATRGADVDVRGEEVVAGGEGTGSRPPVPLTLVRTL